MVSWIPSSSIPSQKDNKNPNSYHRRGVCVPEQDVRRPRHVLLLHGWQVLRHDEYLDAPLGQRHSAGSISALQRQPKPQSRNSQPDAIAAQRNAPFLREMSPFPPQGTSPGTAASPRTRPGTAPQPRTSASRRAQHKQLRGTVTGEERGRRGGGEEESPRTDELRGCRGRREEVVEHNERAETEAYPPREVRLVQPRNPCAISKETWFTGAS